MSARAQHAKVGMDTVESSAGQAPQRPTDVGQTPDIEDLAAEVLKRGQHSAGYHALSDDDVRRVRASLLGWYDLHKREMPWRQATPTVRFLGRRSRPPGHGGNALTSVDGPPRGRTGQHARWTT